MAASLRSYALSLVLLGGILGLALGRPHWLEVALSELASAPPEGGPARGWVEADADPGCAYARARIAAKKRVTEHLFRGELTFLEAVARFRDINAKPEQYPDRFYQLQPGDSDEEKLCRQVILWVASQGLGRVGPGEGDLVAARLEAELAARLSCGRIELPAVR